MVLTSDCGTEAQQPASTEPVLARRPTEARFIWELGDSCGSGRSNPGPSWGSMATSSSGHWDSRRLAQAQLTHCGR